MIAPGSGLAVLIATLVVAAHPLAPSTPSGSGRAGILSVVPTRFDADARRVWRRAIANDDARTLDILLGKHGGERSLVRLGAETGKSALMVACKVGDLALARRLVALGADPRGTTATGGTPFMFAVLGDRLEIARWLHGLGVDVDAQGSNGWTAAMIAAAKGLDGTLAWLLSIGVDAERPDVYGFTPLMRAVDNAHEPAVRRLLAAGVGVVASDEQGNTALHHAVAGGRAVLAELLLEHGADPRRGNRDGITPAQLARSLADETSVAGTRAALPKALLRRLEGAGAALAGEEG